MCCLPNSHCAPDKSLPALGPGLFIYAVRGSGTLIFESPWYSQLIFPRPMSLPTNQSSWTCHYPHNKKENSTWPRWLSTTGPPLPLLPSVRSVRSTESWPPAFPPLWIASSPLLEILLSCIPTAPSNVTDQSVTLKCYLSARAPISPAGSNLNSFQFL